MGGSSPPCPRMTIPTHGLWSGTPRGVGELPGGWVEDGERPEEAALRELFEETGLLGRATHVHSDFFENGDLVRIVVGDEPSPIGWESSDHAIVEVGWCLEIPGLQDWEESEIQRAIDHDWSVSEPLSLEPPESTR